MPKLAHFGSVLPIKSCILKTAKIPKSFQTLFGKLFNKISAGIEGTVEHHHDDLHLRLKRMSKWVHHQSRFFLINRNFHPSRE